jgi:hypothetical protein
MLNPGRAVWRPLGDVHVIPDVEVYVAVLGSWRHHGLPGAAPAPQGRRAATHQNVASEIAMTAAYLIANRMTPDASMMRVNSPPCHR